MPGQARMLVECGPEAALAAVTVKKSATENSQLNKQRSYRHVGRYSGSFSPPGDDIRLAKDSSVFTITEEGQVKSKCLLALVGAYSMFKKTDGSF